MNCKPGDVARIVRTDGVGRHGETFHQAKDRFITVVAIETTTAAGPCWRYEESRIVSDDGKRFATAWPDAWLKPIRDNHGDESFVTEARKSLTITKQNDKLKKVVFQSAPLERAKPAEVEA